jgi:hypothetical protein
MLDVYAERARAEVMRVARRGGAGADATRTAGGADAPSGREVGR